MPQRRFNASHWPLLTAVALVPAVPAWASPPETTEPDLPPIGHALDIGATTDNFRPVGGALGYRLLLSPTLQLGLELRGGIVDRAYIAGYAVENGGFGEGRLAVQGTVLREGPLWLDLRFATGARHQAGAEASPASDAAADVALDAATAVLLDAGIIANIEAGPWLTARTGLSLPVVLQVDPAVGLETQGLLTLFGLAIHVTKDVSITADGNIGGVFGWGGDGNKFAVGGQLGLRSLFGANTRDWRAF